MRIIGGEAKGRRLIAPDGSETRPTLDKTREALFSILMRDVPGARVLDLFGGTGALALEAISRGAESAVICDLSRFAARAIQANITSVTHDDGSVRFIKSDYKAALKALTQEQFDLVFLDPPYAMQDAYAEAIGFLLQNHMLREDFIIVSERAASACVAYPEGVRLKDTRTYRDTAIDFLISDNTGDLL